MPTLKTISPIKTHNKINQITPLVLGNEAIVLGQHDAGSYFITSYPGTPSTEIMEKLIKLSESNSSHKEWNISIRCSNYIL